MEVIPLFSWPLSMWHLPLPKYVLEFAREQENDRHFNVKNDIGNDKHVLHRPGMEGLKEVIQEKIDIFYEQVMNINPKTIKGNIGQSWFTYTVEDQELHYHKHPNAFISGVFYIQTEETDYIQFNNPIRESLYREYRFATQDRYKNEFNAPNTRLPVHPGTLILFPAHTWHQFGKTPSHKPRERPRISLGFDTFFSGTLSFGPQDYSTTIIDANPDPGEGSYSDFWKKDEN